MIPVRCHHCGASGWLAKLASDVVCATCLSDDVDLLDAARDHSKVGTRQFLAISDAEVDELADLPPLDDRYIGATNRIKRCPRCGRTRVSGSCPDCDDEDGYGGGRPQRAKKKLVKVRGGGTAEAARTDPDTRANLPSAIQTAERQSAANGHFLGPWIDHEDHHGAHCENCGRSVSVTKAKESDNGTAHLIYGSTPVARCEGNSSHSEYAMSAKEHATQMAQLWLDNDQGDYNSTRALANISTHPVELQQHLHRFISNLPSSHGLKQEMKDHGYTVDHIDTDGLARDLLDEKAEQDNGRFDIDPRHHLRTRSALTKQAAYNSLGFDGVKKMWEGYRGGKDHVPTTSPNTHIWGDENGNLHVRYYNTDILSYSGDGRHVTFRHNGWRTSNTTKRMNRFGPKDMEASMGQRMHEAGPSSPNPLQPQFAERLGDRRVNTAGPRIYHGSEGHSHLRSGSYMHPDQAEAADVHFFDDRPSTTIDTWTRQGMPDHEVTRGNPVRPPSARTRRPRSDSRDYVPRGTAQEWGLGDNHYTPAPSVPSGRQRLVDHMRDDHASTWGGVDTLNHEDLADEHRFLHEPNRLYPADHTHAEGEYESPRGAGYSRERDRRALEEAGRSAPGEMTGSETQFGFHQPSAPARPRGDYGPGGFDPTNLEHVHQRIRELNDETVQPGEHFDDYMRRMNTQDEERRRLKTQHGLMPKLERRNAVLAALVAKARADNPRLPQQHARRLAVRALERFPALVES